MKKPRSSEHGGSSFLEFVLIGIPMIFVLFSTAELARGMWTYHTLSYAVREGTRYASVHGLNCASSPNSCTVSLGQIAAVIKKAGVGLDPAKLNLVFTPYSGSATSCVLNNCLNNNNTWPPTSANTPGLTVSISAIYPFASGIALVWPGVKTYGPYPAVYFPAASTDIIQF